MRVLDNILFSLVFLGALMIAGKVYAQERADFCMAIGLDVSGSIDANEAALQYAGLATALTHERFIRAVEMGRHGTIAVAVYTWSEVLTRAQVIVPWTGVRSAGDTQAVADILNEQSTTHQVRSTSLYVAITFGTALLAECPWFADQQLLNIAGDGNSNIATNTMVATARDEAQNRGIRINGLVIGDDPATVHHYDNHVITKPLGFYVTVSDYEGFAGAMLRKFILEIAQG